MYEPRDLEHDSLTDWQPGQRSAGQISAERPGVKPLSRESNDLTTGKCNVYFDLVVGIAHN